MRIELSTAHGRWAARLDQPIDLSVGVRLDGRGARAFGLPRAEQTPFAVPGFVADTAQGASCNVARLTLHPHGDGTHTESAQHLDHTAPGVDAVRPAAPLLAWLVTTTPTLAQNGDRIVDVGAFEDALRAVAAHAARALIVRTDRSAARGHVDWSDTNPPYLTAAAVAAVRDAGIEHLLLDLPSVDRESDGGRMAAHHAFFDHRTHAATITEMIAVPDDLRDGLFLLWLALPNIATDAVPSAPVVFALEPLP